MPIRAVAPEQRRRSSRSRIPRGSPTPAAAIGMLAHPCPGHIPVLVCVEALVERRDSLRDPFHGGE